MSRYRDDRAALRERNESLEGDLEEAARKLRDQEETLRAQQRELERLRAGRSTPTQPRPARRKQEPAHVQRAPAEDPSAVVVHGKVLSNERIRYYTEGGALNVVMGAAFIAAGLGISLVATGVFPGLPLLMFSALSLFFFHRRGIDVLPKEQIVVAWHWILFRYGHQRIPSDRIVIQNRSISSEYGDPRKVANLYLGGVLLGKSMRRDKAWAIAEEVAVLCGDAPPESVGS